MTDDLPWYMPDGSTRRIAGRLRYETPPEPGTIVGPTWTREYLVVLGPASGSDRRTVLGYAIGADRGDADARLISDREPPRSVTEARWRAAVTQARIGFLGVGQP